MYDISLERSSYSASAHVFCLKIDAEMTEILQVIIRFSQSFSRSLIKKLLLFNP